MGKTINNIQIENLLSKYTLNWNLNPDVNILVGINGSGKSTVLRKIDQYFNEKESKKRVNDVRVEPDISNFLECQLISTFDVLVRDKRRLKTKETPLDLELSNLLYDIKGQRTFTNYRFKATNFPDQANKVNGKIEMLFRKINNLFSQTSKKIEINTSTNQLQLINDMDEIIKLSQLSSGEKQLLIILFTVFLMEEEPFLLLMDEPEISLHIEWQQKLIDVIRDLNPNCQIVIATHSPSIFGDGWGDKVFFMDDLVRVQ